jgi:threonine dehydrogenase-like Zn-dependent dehydrogenase
LELENQSMKALLMRQPGEVVVDEVPDVVAHNDDVLLKVRMVGLCGSDLNSYLGKNPMVAYPRILGHEVAATIVEGCAANPLLVAGTTVTLSPYTSCGSSMKLWGFRGTARSRSTLPFPPANCIPPI